MRREALASAGQNLQTAIASPVGPGRGASRTGPTPGGVRADSAKWSGIAERTDVILDHALVEAAASVVAAAAAHHPASASHDSRAAALLAAKGVTLDLRRVLASVTQSQPASPSPTEADGSDVGASFADVFGTPEGPANAASRRSATGIREMAAGNRAAFVEPYREDAEIRLLTSLEHSVFAHQVLDREQFADAALSTIEGELSTQAVVAVRGDDLFLGLLIMTSPQRRRFYFQVMQTDGSNAIRHDVYGPDQVWDAIDRLDELWLGSNATVSARSQYLRAISTGEADAIRAVVADDFTSVDHRHSVRGRCAREAWTQAHAALDGAGPAIVPVEVIRHESHGDDVVELGWFRTLVDDTSSDSLRVVWSRGSLLMRADVFDVDDAAGANSLVDEIVVDLSSSGVSQDADDPWFANEAWRTGEELLGLIERGATRSEVLATFHDDFTSRGSERFDLGEVLDAPAWLDSVLQIINSAANSESEAELLAVRGEEWALGRLRSVIDGSVVEKLRILHVEDGLIRSFQLFDPDQLAEAVQELDRLWSESGRETPSFAASRRVGEVLTRGDRDEYRNMFVDDFLAVDHQRIGMGREPPTRWSSPLRPATGELTTFAVHFLGIAEFHTLFLTDMRVGETDSNWRMLCLLAVDPDTQRLTTVETFDESDCDAALADSTSSNRPGAPTTPLVATRSAGPHSSTNSGWRTMPGVPIDPSSRDIAVEATATICCSSSVTTSHRSRASPSGSTSATASTQTG